MNSSEVRTKLIEEFKKYMMGPHWGNEEIIDKSPKFTYMTGILYPQDSEVEQENVKNETSDDSETEPPDRTVLNSLNPSSFGLTCMLDPQTKNFKVRAVYGIYVGIKSEKTKSPLYKRQHFDKEYEFQTSENDEQDLEIPFGQIKANLRKTKTGILCSVYMINTHKAIQSKSSNIIFQPRIEIISDLKQIIHSEANDLSRIQGLDDNLFDLIFEGKRNFGFGHGCAVSWDEEEVTGKNIGS